MSNSIDPDETAHYEPSHLDLCCLQKPISSPMAVKELIITLLSPKSKWFLSKLVHQQSSFWKQHCIHKSTFCCAQNDLTKSNCSIPYHAQDKAKIFLTPFNSVWIIPTVVCTEIFCSQVWAKSNKKQQYSESEANALTTLLRRTRNTRQNDYCLVL